MCVWGGGGGREGRKERVGKVNGKKDGKEQCHVQTFSSLVPRPHPAHARRRGLVLQVGMLGLAPETRSGQ